MFVMCDQARNKAGDFALKGRRRVEVGKGAQETTNGVARRVLYFRNGAPTTFMLLSITTTYRPATDLGFLLHKNPVRSQELELGFGRAHMFYPEASNERCTFALLLDIDPVGLVRGTGR